MISSLLRGGEGCEKIDFWDGMGWDDRCDFRPVENIFMGFACVF